MKKIITTILVTSSLFSLAACNIETSSNAGSNQSSDETINNEKTQLFVGNLLGGYGEEWLRSVKARFENEFEDAVFESGKKGVQVIIDSNRNTYKGDLLAGKIAGLKQEVFFTESVNYYEYVLQNKIADISDIVTEPLTIYGESESIANKMSLEQNQYLTAKDGKYYALPFYEAYDGINYDIDLFEQKKFFFAKNVNNGNNGFIIANTDERAAGPDAEYGTYDDGLPATYADFAKLIDYMANKGVVPITWTGQYQEYMNKFAAGLAVDADGFDNALISSSFSGTLNNIVNSIDTKGIVTYKPTTQINAENGYLSFQTSGRYYALKFIEQIVKNSKLYSNNAFNNSKSHLGAQEDFLYSKYLTNEPIAMLVEGSWWENEATGIFNDMMTQGFGEEVSKYNRKFGFMPYPKATQEKVGEQLTLMDFNNSLSFINANVNAEKLAVAKKFLQFCHTNASLVDFTIKTNTPKPYHYQMSEAEKEQLSSYGRSLFNLHEIAKVLYPYSYNEIYIKMPGELGLPQTFSGSVNNVPYTLPSSALKENTNVNALNYFWAITKQYDQNWWNVTFFNN